MNTYAIKIVGIYSRRHMIRIPKFKKFYILVPLNILIKYMYHTSPNPYIMVFKTCYSFIIETKNVTQMNVWPIKWYGFEKTQKVTGWCNTILKVIYINV